MILYREVKASERLPEKLESEPDFNISDDVFVVIRKGNKEMTAISYYDYDTERWNKLYGAVTHWLEPIEITEEEIENIIKSKKDYGRVVNYEEAAKAILSKLKGE